MNNSRRVFIKNSAFVLAGAALMPRNLFASSAQIQHLSLQLYSVRDAMRDDPAGTLKKLAEIGYKHVEHAGYNNRKFYGYPVKEFKKLLDDNGLYMVSGHIVLSQKHWDSAANDFTDEWKNIVQDAAEVGQKYLISPGLDFNLWKDETAFKAFMNVFNKCGELCQRSGLRFGYHNHDFEFKSMFGDKRLYDVMLENTDSKLVAQQLDVGNMYPTGAMPLDYIKKYPGRFELMHVKDMFKPAGSDRYESTLLGKGVLPLKDILKAGKKIGGTSQFIIEQEEYQGMDPLVAAKSDLHTMNTWGY